jgi:hypothetical protein
MIFFESTLWDLSDDGLTYRVIGELPARPDPLGKLLRTSGQVWTAAVGYAQVKNIFASDDGRLLGTGGDSWLVNVGRRWHWNFPEMLTVAGWKPRFETEAGLHYSSESLPAHGTHFQFLLAGGFEWRRTIAEESQWVFGVRWLHYSNAGAITPNRGYDSFVFRIGRDWRW